MTQPSDPRIVATVHYDVLTTIDTSYYADACTRSPGLRQLVNLTRGPVQRATVIQSADAAHVALPSPGPFGVSVGYIETRSALIWLDLAGPTHMAVPESRRLRVTYPNVKIGTHASDATDVHDGRRVTEFQIHVATPTDRATLQLWLCADPDLTPFREAMARLLVAGSLSGGYGKFPWGDVVSRGAPLRGALLVEEKRPVMEFSVEHLQQGTSSRAAFAPDPASKDLSNAPAPEKPLRVQRRLSSTGKHPATPNQRSPRRNRAQPSPRDTSTDTTADIPPCIDGTLLSGLAVDVSQVVFDDAMSIANQVSQRLSGFNATGGTLTINWLSQFQQFNQSVGPQGDALYWLLRDDSLNGFGLLDQLASRQASVLLQNATSPLSLANITIDPATLAAISAVLINPTVSAADRFGNLDAVSQAKLREAVLWNTIGALSIPYSDTTPQNVLGNDFWGQLINIQFSGIAFDFAINNASVLTSLNIESPLTAPFPTSPAIVANVGLAGASGSATVIQTPTAGATAALAGLGVIGIFGGIGIGGGIAAASVFWILATNVGALNISITGLDLVAAFALEALPSAPNVLTPQVGIAINAQSVDALYLSYIPVGLTQIIEEIVVDIVLASGIILSQLQSNMQTILNNLLAQSGVAFPWTNAPFQATPTNETQDSVTRKDLFLEASVTSASSVNAAPFITEVNRVLTPIRTLGAVFGNQIVPLDQAVIDTIPNSTPTREYASFALSQNMLNQYLFWLWTQGDFNQSYTQAEISSLISGSSGPTFLGVLAVAPAGVAGQVPAGLQQPNDMTMALWPAAPPRVQVTPGASQPLEIFFDDLRLCVHGSPFNQEPIMQVIFAARAPAQLGFGQVLTVAGQPQLVLTGIGLNLMDFYLSGIPTPSEIGPGQGTTIISTESNVQEVTILPHGDQVGNPLRGAVAADVPGLPSVLGWNDWLAACFSVAFSGRSDSVISMATSASLAGQVYQQYLIGNPPIGGQGISVGVWMNAVRGVVQGKLGVLGLSLDGLPLQADQATSPPGGGPAPLNLLQTSPFSILGIQIDPGALGEALRGGIALEAQSAPLGVAHNVPTQITIYLQALVSGDPLAQIVAAPQGPLPLGLPTPTTTSGGVCGQMINNVLVPFSLVMPFTLPAKASSLSFWYMNAAAVAQETITVTVPGMCSAVNTSTTPQTMTVPYQISFPVS